MKFDYQIFENGMVLHTLANKLAQLAQKIEAVRVRMQNCETEDTCFDLLNELHGETIDHFESMLYQISGQPGFFDAMTWDNQQKNLYHGDIDLYVGKIRRVLENYIFTPLYAKCGKGA